MHALLVPASSVLLHAWVTAHLHLALAPCYHYTSAPLHICTQLHTFTGTSAHLHIICTPGAHLHICSFNLCTHMHLCTSAPFHCYTSAHLHCLMHICTPPCSSACKMNMHSGTSFISSTSAPLHQCTSAPPSPLPLCTSAHLHFRNSDPTLNL